MTVWGYLIWGALGIVGLASLIGLIIDVIDEYKGKK